MSKVIHLALFSTLLLGVAPVAIAQDHQTDAEMNRLSGEMDRLAGRNAWTGVDRIYLQLLDLTTGLDANIHMLGAEAARNMGKIYEMYRRHERVAELDPNPEVLEVIKAMEGAYGRIKIKGSSRWKVALERPSMPFAPDERKGIEYAKMILAETGNFEGMLPAGAYKIGQREFSVEAGTQWQEIKVEKSDISGRDGLVIYAGPVFNTGYHFTTSSVSVEVEGEDGRHMPVPDTFSGNGVAFDLGGEVGFSRMFGIVATIGYRGLYGTDTFHSTIGTIGAAIRPGDFRFVVAPSYGLIKGNGIGVAEWFDINQDKEQYPTSDLSFEGRAMIGGVGLSAGYSVVDFSDTLQGAIELGGSWYTDGARPYMSFGVRFGIVPTVPRFKES